MANLEGQIVEIGGQQYTLTPVASAQSQSRDKPMESLQVDAPPPLPPRSPKTKPSNLEPSAAPVAAKQSAADVQIKAVEPAPEAGPVAIDTNATQEAQPAETKQDNGQQSELPRSLTISRTSITHPETEDLLHTISMSSKREWSLSSKSLVTVAGIGTLRFHSMDEHQIDANPTGFSAFEIFRGGDGVWYFKSFNGTQRWHYIDGDSMGLIYDTVEDNTVEIARLTGSTLEFKSANLEERGGWESVVLSAVAMKEQKIRDTEGDQAVGVIAQNVLGQFGISLGGSS